MFYIVSGHGGRENLGQASASGPITPIKLQIPAGFEVHFYVRDNDVLLNTTAFKIYKELTTTGFTFVQNRILSAGEQIDDYFCYDMPEHKSYSHVLTVESSSKSSANAASATSSSSASTPSAQWAITATKPLNQYSSIQALHLRTLFKIYENAPAPIHWLACTVASQSKRVVFTD